MIVIGAKGHAKEVLEICLELGLKEDLFFFDNINLDTPRMMFNTFPVLSTFEEVKEKLKSDTSFISAIGNPKLRKRIVNQFLEIGGNYKSIISKTAQIGGYEVAIDDGCNIMSNVYVSNSVSIGKGCLINKGASIHHDVSLGHYCDISPGAIILGRVKIGDHVSIGAGAIILPDINIGDNVTVGAGSVVTKNVESGNIIVGVPGKKK